MARSQLELQTVLAAIQGIDGRAYFQKETGLVYPCIRYARDDSAPFHADNLLYMFKKRYTVTVIDRDPGSAIPDQVEKLPLTRFDRFYVVNGLNHFVFKLFF